MVILLRNTLILLNCQDGWSGLQIKEYCIKKGVFRYQDDVVAPLRSISPQEGYCWQKSRRGVYTSRNKTNKQTTVTEELRSLLIWWNHNRTRRLFSPSSSYCLDAQRAILHIFTLRFSVYEVWFKFLVNILTFWNGWLWL